MAEWYYINKIPLLRFYREYKNFLITEKSIMNDVEKMSYALGMNIAGNIAELPLEIDTASLVKALQTVLADDGGAGGGI